MSEKTAARAAAAARKRRADFEVRFTGAETEQMRQWLGDGAEYIDQGGGDLGSRLKLAFADAFAAGYSRVAIIGADCPDLSETRLIAALKRLAEHDLVLGPCADGGYYLIGLTAPAPSLFTDIPWGGDQVATHTLARAAKRGLKSFLLEELRDVDRPEDLEHIGDHPLP